LTTFHLLAFRRWSQLEEGYSEYVFVFNRTQQKIRGSRQRTSRRFNKASLSMSGQKMTLTHSEFVQAIASNGVVLGIVLPVTMEFES